MLMGAPLPVTCYPQEAQISSAAKAVATQSLKLINATAENNIMAMARSRILLSGVMLGYPHGIRTRWWWRACARHRIGKSNRSAV